jgi:hypothetical protein
MVGDFLAFFLLLPAKLTIVHHTGSTPENSICMETQGFGQSPEEVEEKRTAQSQDEEHLQERL